MWEHEPFKLPNLIMFFPKLCYSSTSSWSWPVWPQAWPSSGSGLPVWLASWEETVSRPL